MSNTVYGGRHSKLFTNCHVSWDTLYVAKIWELNDDLNIAFVPNEIMSLQ